MRWPRATAPAWIVHAGFVTSALAGGVGYALGGAHARAVVYTLIVLLSIGLFGQALLAGHLTHRRPWLVAIGGLVLLLVDHLIWPYWIIDGHLGRAEGRPADLVLAAAHGLFLIGASMAVRHRMSADAGGIVEAAIFGACTGGALWACLFQPHLAATATPIGAAQVLTDVLVLCAVAGCLLRMAVVATGPARGTLGYLLLTVLLTGSALAVGSVGAPHRGTLSGLLMLIAFLTIGFGAVHPGAPATVEPDTVTERRPGRFRLSWLGAALSVNPAIAAIQAAHGVAAPDPQLPVATLLVIPLVMVRFRQLTGQRERAEEVLAYQASHDELTGLFNRRRIMAEIDTALTGPHDVTVLLCDLDGFKPVNDRHGHAAGDHVLRTVGERLTTLTGPAHAVGRLGGDEFLVLCRGGTPDEIAALRATIQATVLAPITLPTGSVAVGVTIGTAQAPAGGRTDRATLIAQADARMYDAKPRRRHPAA
ncbi:putative signaling protein [Actinoplanes sp. SE50]|uniref:GGDEF domain-containing protein n=1 Tax=unclassified Actinoplanes TaxID=2626549 RepID=UPI00023EC23A|nr:MULTISPECIES: GGDEF domain-containing protein [unclassified Actinoplanes]AEV83009.1 putative signaling protein [Actinoplanes sp. SE50/110]ATO81405.1 putative signaling protein [Actinoplanes sp. SE50]SLL98812.1 putative signaling protein [Actinoplanes sp. SE50/110]